MLNFLLGRVLHFVGTTLLTKFPTIYAFEMESLPWTCETFRWEYYNDQREIINIQTVFAPGLPKWIVNYYESAYTSSTPSKRISKPFLCENVMNIQIFAIKSNSLFAQDGLTINWQYVKTSLAFTKSQASRAIQVSMLLKVFWCVYSCHWTTVEGKPRMGQAKCLVENLV